MKTLYVCVYAHVYVCVCIILSMMLDTKYVLNISAVLFVFVVIRDDLKGNF